MIVRKKVTELRLQLALERILLGKTQKVKSTRKLSISAVEEEAGLGRGSAYYYPHFIKEIKNSIVDSRSSIHIKGKTSAKEKYRGYVEQVNHKRKKHLNEIKRLKRCVNETVLEHANLVYQLYLAHNKQSKRQN